MILGGNEEKETKETIHFVQFGHSFSLHNSKMILFHLQERMIRTKEKRIFGTEAHGDESRVTLSEVADEGSNIMFIATIEI